MYTEKQVADLENRWKQDPRWKGVKRTYSAESVLKLQGTLKITHTLATLGALKLWEMLEKDPFVRALGAITGNQAVEMVQAGLKAIYLSGWQVAGESNDSLETYPDLSLYPVQSVPHLARRINRALSRADQIEHLQNKHTVDWFVPLIADAEAGFGGPLNAFELVKSMIEAGVAAVHLEDQLSSLKKCGHMGGKVLVPAADFVEKLVTSRLAADVMEVPTLIIARTDAESASYIRSDADATDQPFLTGKRSVEGFYELKSGIEYAVARANRFAPYADLVWCETSKPDLGEAREFAAGVHEKHPGKWLAYNCSPSFNWKKHLDDKQIATFQEKLGEMGYKFQFITLAGFHSINAGMYELARGYTKEGMSAYARLQEKEFQMEAKDGYTAVKHQAFVGAGYFDEVLETITSGKTSAHALKGSTEEKQF